MFADVGAIVVSNNDNNNNGSKNNVQTIEKDRTQRRIHYLPSLPGLRLPTINIGTVHWSPLKQFLKRLIKQSTKLVDFVCCCVLRLSLVAANECCSLALLAWF